MGRFSKYPYTDFNDLNLDWILQRMREVEAELQRYLDNSVITFADPITWDITEQYTALTVVVDSDGTAYLSKQPVPSGVAITNTNYWLPIFNYDDNINELRAQIAYNAQTSATTGQALAAGDLVFWNGIIYKVLADMPAGTAFIEDTNITQYTVDQKINDIPDYSGDISDLRADLDQEILDRDAADVALSARIDAIAAATQFFDTVAAMKAAAIDAGVVCMTQGYYAVNDGGGAYYKIYDSVPAGYYEILDNSNYAQLLDIGEKNVKQYGAYGDGTHDDTAAINTALSYGGVINFTGDHYLIDAVTALHPVNNSIIHGNNAILDIIPNNASNYSGFLIDSVDNVTIDALTINGDKNTHTGTTGEWGHGIAIADSDFITLRDITINTCWGDGIYIGGNSLSSTNIFIDNMTCDANRRNGISIVKAVDVIVNNSKFTSTTGTAPQAGIAVESNSAADLITRVQFNNCLSAYNSGDNSMYVSIHQGGLVEFHHCKFINIGKTGTAFTVLGAESSACQFEMHDCVITAAVPILCSGINQNSQVNIENCDLFRVITSPIRFTSGVVSYCQNIHIQVTVFDSVVSEGAFLCLTALRRAGINIKFIGCDITDPRVLGSNNVDLESCLIELDEDKAKVYSIGAGSYLALGGSNNKFIVDTSWTGAANLFGFSCMPIGTEYTIMNKSSYNMNIGSLPTYKFENLAGAYVPPNSCLKMRRIDGTHVVGECYTFS